MVYIIGLVHQSLLTNVSKSGIIYKLIFILNKKAFYLTSISFIPLYFIVFYYTVNLVLSVKKRTFVYFDDITKIFIFTWFLILLEIFLAELRFVFFA